MDKRKFLIHTLGVFITITAMQSFVVKIELPRDSGWLWYFEFAKAVFFRDLLVKLMIALGTGYIIVRAQEKACQAAVKRNLKHTKKTVGKDKKGNI